MATPSARPGRSDGPPSSRTSSTPPASRPSCPGAARRPPTTPRTPTPARPPGHARVGVASDTCSTAVYLARLLGPGVVDCVTNLGAAALSDATIAAMAGEGVGTTLVGRHPGRLPGLCVIAVDGRAGGRSPAGGRPPPRGPASGGPARASTTSGPSTRRRCRGSRWPSCRPRCARRRSCGSGRRGRRGAASPSTAITARACGPSWPPRATMDEGWAVAAVAQPSLDEHARGSATPWPRWSWAIRARWPRARPTPRRPHGVRPGPPPACRPARGSDGRRGPRRADRRRGAASLSWAFHGASADPRRASPQADVSAPGTAQRPSGMAQAATSRRKSPTAAR